MNENMLCTKTHEYVLEEVNDTISGTSRFVVLIPEYKPKLSAIYLI